MIKITLGGERFTVYEEAEPISEHGETYRQYAVVHASGVAFTGVAEWDEEITEDFSFTDSLGWLYRRVTGIVPMAESFEIERWGDADAESQYAAEVAAEE